MESKNKFDELIGYVIGEGASDLHLSVGRPPIVRVNGILIPMVHSDPLSLGEMNGFIKELLSEDDQKILDTKKEVDFSYEHSDKNRFRGNAFYQRETLSMSLRLIPKAIRTIEELNLPPILNSFVERQQGFFLVVGPIGHGKTTTLASMVEMINASRAEHIMTIEDPIEYVYEPKMSIIDQREVRTDTTNFESALSAVFRQDVDVLMIGEMRNTETISTAVTAAETGHLVFSTLHTNNAAQTIDRIIDSFPAEQQEQIRIQLAGSLSGIFSQRLIPRVSGGLIPAYELLMVNNAVSNLIREKRTHEINIVIETGADQGMIDMNRCLADLVRKGEITPENAYLYSFNPKILEKLI